MKPMTSMPKKPTPGMASVGTETSAARLIAQADRILETAADARGTLESAQAELERANDQAARVIAMAGPMERGVDRLDRIVSRVRRDEGTGEGS